MTTSDDARSRAANAYNAAADCYDDPANSFWDRFGQRTIQRLTLKTGARVLDVCCGSGASALAAAEVVGPSGFVVGVDLAEDLVQLARRKALTRDLENVDFRVGDLLNLEFEEQFDAVVCVFGIFFLADMTAAVRSLWQHVLPGGTLALTTWGPNFFEPANTVFWNSIREVRPNLYKDFNPWDRICEPQSLRNLFNEAGIDEVKVEAEYGFHKLSSPQAWWSAVLGSGYRGTVEQLQKDEFNFVRQTNWNYINTTGLRSVEANVVYGVAVKK